MAVQGAHLGLGVTPAQWVPVGGSLKPQAWGTAPSDIQSSSPTLLQGTHVEEWTNTTPWGN